MTSAYELRRHLADVHGIHLRGMSYARMDDIHRGEHWPDPSHEPAGHDHDEAQLDAPGIPPG